MQQRYIVTLAQNATPVHNDFFASLCQYPADLLVIGGRYVNRKSPWATPKLGDDWYDPLVVPFLCQKRIDLAPGLRLFGDIPIRLTARRPLGGFEPFSAPYSAIFGHPKRAVQVVATTSRSSRALFTTGACTVPNYIECTTGAFANAQHCYGALIVEVASDGSFHIREIEAAADGSFIDLDKHYSPAGVTDAEPALALTMGDIHAQTVDHGVLKATAKLTKCVKPRNLFLHDVLDFRSRNHHESSNLRRCIEKMRSKVSSIEAEVAETVTLLKLLAKFAPSVTVVRSNHDEAFERYLEETNPHHDIENAPYYFAVWHRMCELHKRTGEWPDAFEMEARRLGVPKNVRFLHRNEDVILSDVHYGFHGDKGINGGRGSTSAYARLGVKTVTGHVHTPGILDSNHAAGLSAALDQNYNYLPSSWAHCHVLQYANGKCTLIFISAGKFRFAA